MPQFPIPTEEQLRQRSREFARIHVDPAAIAVDQIRTEMASLVGAVTGGGDTARNESICLLGLGEGIHERATPEVQHWLGTFLGRLEAGLMSGGTPRTEASKATTPPQLSRPSFQRIKPGRQVIGSAGRHGLKLFGITMEEGVAKPELKPKEPPVAEEKPQEAEKKRPERKERKDRKKAA